MNAPPRPPTIRVVFVDDHPLLREGTQALLERTTGIDLVGVTGNGTRVMQQIESLRPDVLLLDLRLPDMNGVEVAHRVRQQFPEVAILVLTGFDDSGYVRALNQLGIRGYLDKSVTGDQIIMAIRAVATGQIVVVCHAIHSAGGSPHLLTGREQEVLYLLARGRRNKEIAQTLGVSEKTVEFHVTNLFTKLGAQSRIEAALTAWEQGLLNNFPTTRFPVSQAAREVGST